MKLFLSLKFGFTCHFGATCHFVLSPAIFVTCHFFFESPVICVATCHFWIHLSIFVATSNFLLHLSLFVSHVIFGVTCYFCCSLSICCCHLSFFASSVCLLSPVIFLSPFFCIVCHFLLSPVTFAIIFVVTCKFCLCHLPICGSPVFFVFTCHFCSHLSIYCCCLQFWGHLSILLLPPVIFWGHLSFFVTCHFLLPLFLFSPVILWGHL